MDENFIRRQVLAIDRAAEARVRKYINAYAASSKGHPFANYGDDIKLDTYELCPIYIVSLRTQYDYRYVDSGSYPYKNTALPARSVFNMAEVDPWSFELRTTDRFVEAQCADEVEGSQVVRDCIKCSGTGTVTCPTCGGKGTVACPKCGGSGSTPCNVCGGRGSNQCTACHGSGTIQKSREERYILSDTNWDGTKKSSPTYGYRTIYTTVSCSSCNGRGKNDCNACDGTGKRTCTACDNGRVTCSQCNGNKKVTCDTCMGHGRLVHAFYVNQKLYNTRDKSYFFDPRVRDVAEIYEQNTYRGHTVLDRTAARLEPGFFSGESGMAAELNKFIAKHEGESSRSTRILFQQATIFRIDAWWVEYTYGGKHYDGVISDDHFYAGVSPISEFSDEVLEEADKHLGGTGTLKARKFVDQAESLDVYDNRARVSRLRELVEKHLNTMYKLGTDLMFWLIALFVTPFLYNFYDSLNPVLRYAHFTNDPLWGPYNWVPAIQCVIFLLLLLIAKIGLNGINHGRDRHVSVFGFILSGMGLYLIAAVVILAVVLGLNYLGLSIVTTWVGYAIWRVIRFVLLAVVLIAALLVELVKWLWGLIF